MLKELKTIKFGNYDELPFKELSFHRQNFGLRKLDLDYLDSQYDHDVSLSIVKKKKDDCYYISLRIYSSNRMVDRRDAHQCQNMTVSDVYARKRFDDANGKCKSDISDQEIIMVDNQQYETIAEALNQLELMLSELSINDGVSEVISRNFSSSTIFSWQPVIPKLDINESCFLPIEQAVKIKKVDESFTGKGLVDVSDNYHEGYMIYDVYIGVGKSEQSFYHVILMPVAEEISNGNTTIENELIHFHGFESLLKAKDFMDKIDEYPNLKYWTEIPNKSWPFDLNRRRVS